MPPPTNTSAATATAIATLPLAASVDLTDLAPSTAVSLWWTYTAASEVVLGVYATRGDGDPDNTALTVWVGTPGALTLHMAFDARAAPQIVPVTAAVTYFLEVACTPLLGGATPTLVLSVLPGPTAALPVGTLLINDELAGHPATFLSAVDGTVLQYRRLPAAGEIAAMLETGVSLWEEAGAPTVLRLYTATLTLAASPVVAGRTAEQPIGSNRTDRFYVVAGSVVQTITATGTAGPDTWTIPGPAIHALEPSPDETVLYYIPAGGSTAVQRWDLVSDTALSDLAAGVPGYITLGAFGDEFLVLPDGSVIVPYEGATDSVLRRYSPAGALLQTYALGAVEVNRVTYDAVDEAAAFWVWSFLWSTPPTRNGYARIQSLRVSDGAVLTTFDTALFTEGAYDPFTVPPDARWGHAPSCAFVALRQALGTPTNPPPAWTLDERHLRRLRRAPHVNAEHKRVFFRSFELDLERGQGLATGQGEDPIITLRLSRDGGQTWGEPVPLHAGALGAYTQRVIARRLGVARDTVFEVTVSDPVAWSLVGAWLDLEPGTS